MPLFGSSKKSPSEVVKIISESFQVLDTDSKGKKAEKAHEDISKQIQTCKNMIIGNDQPDNQSELVAQLAQEFYNNNVFLILITNLERLDFEARKDVVQIFGALLRRQIGARAPTVDFINNKNEVLFTLLKGYETPEIAVNAGMILRECIRYEPLAALIIKSPKFYNLFNYVELSTFDVASDAFSTFKFFGCYRVLLDSENYVTKRQSLKLLGELLLDRHNFVVMTKYISNPENLKLMMNMLRDKSRNIQFEAFHVFKVFVANPIKTPPILDILLKNKEKLVEFLMHFHADRTEDEQFNDEKTYLIKQIKELQPASATAATPSATNQMDQTPAS
ncbi:calcium-binding protein 39-like isoform X2 [Clytia hemisphaerica]|uniref:calcium-binding protein 39-like isoform X2 n=1 Tax=Clytia hemisphaerica TaxID=252671 RepID=UPI0034D57854